jgi:TatD DNase family protein
METKPEYFDTHAHLNFSAYDKDREDVIKRTLAGDVWVINVGTQKDTSRTAVLIADEHERGVYATVGIHPIHANVSFWDSEELKGGGPGFTSRGESFDMDLYTRLAENKKVVAIGECGLDYFRLTLNEAEERKRQKDVFEAQIALALKLDLPLMIHCRPSTRSLDAYADVHDMLKSYSRGSGGSLKIHMHFFAGDLDTARKFLDIGAHLSFTGVLTLTTDYDEIASNVPLDRLMSETDCPYVAPKSHRGKRNEPLYVKDVISRLVEIRPETEAKIKKALVDNAFEFYRIEQKSQK